MTAGQRTETVHTCSYECERPGCIRAQRDELAARLTTPPSAPVGVEGLLADLETIWHSVSDDKETNAAYQRLKSALAQQPAAVDGMAELVGLLDEVRSHFTRDDDLPDDLLPRIDAAIAAQHQGDKR